MTGASPTSRCSRRGSRGGEWPPSPTRSCTRSSTCSTSTVGRCSTSRSRSGAGSWRRSCAPDPRVRLSEHVEARRDRVLRGGTDARPRGDHGQGPPLAVRARQARPIAGRRSRSAPSRSSSSAAGCTGTGKAVDLGALLVGVYEDGELRYAGKVGAGFTAERRAELLAGRRAARRRGVTVRDAAPARRGPRRPVAAPRARHPRRVRRLDGRRPRPPGGLQGHRAREGPAQGHPRAPEA